MIHYLRDPEKIDRKTYEKIREITILDRFTAEEKQVVLHLIRACGEPALAEKIRFSPQAIEQAKKAIKKYAYLLYDYETVRGGLDSSLLSQEPLCFMNKATVISQAKLKNQTRAMTAVDYWKPYIKGSIILFGHSNTALLHLLELLQAGDLEKPAVVIAMASGFVNTEEAKQLLIESYSELTVEYILIEGRWGGSMFAATAMNALLKIQQEIYV